MSLFLPDNLSPLPSASSLKDNPLYSDSEYFVIPEGTSQQSVRLDYVQLLDERRSDPKSYVATLLKQTPKPKGRYAFSNIHIVGPAENVPGGLSEEAETTIRTILEGAPLNGKEAHLHRLPRSVCSYHPSSGSSSRSNNSRPNNRNSTCMDEYNAIFETATSLLLQKADRASLLVFVGWDDHTMDDYAAFIGMLPFRGVQVALITRNTQQRSRDDWLKMTTPSGSFVIDALESARMGKFSLHTVYGPNPNRTIEAPVKPWEPVSISTKLENVDETDIVHLPFKIGGLELPMLTHNGAYDDAMQGLADLLSIRYPEGYTPIVSCGETCDALGYGQDLLDTLDQDESLLFTHKSGETYKRYQNYGTYELFEKINCANRSPSPPLIIAVGGGVNGNCIGLIAALTNTAFIEVPTTPMHYNDAVTSAKKAVSLVVDDAILSKNILGTFYLPQLAYCVNECLLTISDANAYATVGESCKTMNMLGIANSSVGADDFNNILGAQEFASDFTKILNEVEGFDHLIDFIQSPTTLREKQKIINLGKKIASLRNKMSDLESDSNSDSSSEDEEMNQENNTTYQSLIFERKLLLKAFRKSFHSLPMLKKKAILSFLTVINKEIVAAKAMFLAYSDPFEKYRALLFEYAHTLGHGVEAFANDLYLKARKLGVQVKPDAFRLHGQCVGMAVLWAGEMSRNLGKLTGQGFVLHQSFPYLFNRSGGFCFGPLRDLCDELGVSKDEFIESVLQVVRRDNKRGYCDCSDPNKSVDQLVCHRPGKMLGSPDPNAEIRYLVEVDESWQNDVLGKAFDGFFDRACDVVKGEIVFVHGGTAFSSAPTHVFKSSSTSVASHVRSELLAAYSKDSARMVSV